MRGGRLREAEGAPLPLPSAPLLSPAFSPPALSCLSVRLSCLQPPCSLLPPCPPPRVPILRQSLYYYSITNKYTLL